jgi:branched-chain amino acid transport system substrate-binding protein
MMKRGKKLLFWCLCGAGMLLALAGCGSPTASPEESIKIGSIHPITGNYAYEAQSLVNAQQLAIDEINAAGGIKALGGRKLELVVGDSQGSADIGTTETQRLIQAGVVALSGTYQSGVTQTATQEAEKEGIPFVVTISNNVAMFERGFKYSFRIQPNANVFSENFIQYISEVRTDDIQTAVLIHEDSITGSDSSAIIEQNFSRTGMTLLSNIAYSTSATSLSTEVTKIAELKPDLLIMIGYFSDTSMLVREINERNLSFKMVCGVCNGGISDSKFISDFGPAVENYLDLNYRFNPISAKTQTLLSNYQTAYGSDMSVHAVFGYESIIVIADALERAGSTERDALRDALAATDLAEHALAQSGPITFDAKGENINAAGVLVQIQNGKHMVVFPEEFAETELVTGF